MLQFGGSTSGMADPAPQPLDETMQAGRRGKVGLMLGVATD